MSKTPNYDAKVKIILDQLGPGERTCTVLGTKWMMDEAEIEMYRKYNVPPSKYAPLTRMKLLNSHIVIFDLWYNRHVETGKPMASIIHPATGYRVLPDGDWFNRDFSLLGRAVDVSKSFLDQFSELSYSVPRSANFNYVKPENSLAFISRGDVNSYFVLACQSKNTVYSMNATDVEDSAEIELSYHVVRSYNVLHSQNISDSLFIRECLNCYGSAFLFDCRDCEYCFGATNQRHKKYLWFNEQLGEAEWKKRRSTVDLSSYELRREYEARFADLVAKAVWPEDWNVRCEDVSGDYLYGCTRVFNSFYACEGSRDLDWVNLAYGQASNDCALCAAVVAGSDCYYGVGNAECSKNRFSLSILTRCLECEFCTCCMDCEFCFGCVGLRRKKYCILNKQYSEAAYWEKVDAIKCAMLDRGEYGDFPSAGFSTQQWAGCGAVHIYDATKEELLKLGVKDIAPGDDGAEGEPIDPSKLHVSSEIPDRISDDMAGTMYVDDLSRRRFSYLKPELEIYRRLGIAAPRSHPTRRMLDLYGELNMAVEEDVTCAKCSKAILVAKNKKFPVRTVYCKECYLAFLERQS